MNKEATKWDKVYDKAPEELPWFGLSFPPQVEGYLSGLDKTKLVLVTGCGAGDVVKRIEVKGFKQMIGTDISAKAIERAKSRFPGILCMVAATEELPIHNKLNGANVIDWLNLHQVQNIAAYIYSIGETAENVCIAWICDSNQQAFAKSYVHDGNIYYHDPKSVEKLFTEKDMTLKEQFDFSFNTNPAAGDMQVHKAIGQIYAKR